MKKPLTKTIHLTEDWNFSLKTPIVPTFGQIVRSRTKNREKCAPKTFSTKCRPLTIDGNFRACQVLKTSTKSMKFGIWKGIKNNARLLDLGSHLYFSVTGK